MKPTPETDALRKEHSEYHLTFLGDEFRRLAQKLERERDALREAILETIMQNLHLADGDACTLKRLKDAIGFELPENNHEKEIEN